jgi:hypothetical protein
MSVGEVVCSSNPSLNGQLHYPADFDSPLNEAAADRTYNTVLIVIIVLLTLFLLCLLLLVLPDAYTVNSCAFYLSFCRLIEKLTAFLQLQEFSLRKQTSSITVA